MSSFELNGDSGDEIDQELYEKNLAFLRNLRAIGVPITDDRDPGCTDIALD